MGVSRRGLTETLGNGNWQGQERGQDGKPGVLLEQQRICSLGLPGKPDGEVVAESPQLVVPTACTKRERTVNQVGLLVPQQLSHELGSQLYLGLLAEPIEDGHDRGGYGATKAGVFVVQNDGSGLARRQPRCPRTRAQNVWQRPPSAWPKCR
jgi:hypothetical protein